MINNVFSRFILFTLLVLTAFSCKCQVGTNAHEKGSDSGGLLFYAKGDWAMDTRAIENPDIKGALFQVIWSEVEKNKGICNWSEVDSWIEPWIKAGKKVALRIMWSTSGYWTYDYYKHPTPAWVWDEGAVYAYHSISKTEIPLIWDPIYKKNALEFLKQTAQKYDENPNILFIDVTPGAETNPFRFGTIRKEDPDFVYEFELVKASDGRSFLDQNWINTLEDWIISIKPTFKQTPLLITLNRGSIGSEDNLVEIGNICVKNGYYVGQNGIKESSYLKNDERKEAFLEWSQTTKLFFEMVHNTENPNTGSIMGVMKAAERIHCSFLNVYPTDVLKGTVGYIDFSKEYETALDFGEKILTE